MCKHCDYNGKESQEPGPKDFEDLDSQNATQCADLYESEMGIFEDYRGQDKPWPRRVKDFFHNIKSSLTRFYWDCASLTWNYSVWKDDCEGQQFHAWNKNHAEKKGQRLAIKQGWKDAYVMKGNFPWPEDF